MSVGAFRNVAAVNALRRIGLTWQPNMSASFRTFTSSRAVGSPSVTESIDAIMRNDFPPFAIIDTTLREGEQHSTTEFTSHDRMYIAKLLDKMGVDFIEMCNPVSSEQALKDCQNAARLGLKAKLVVHTRCHMDDVRAAVEAGVDGVSMYMATSEKLRRHSHGKGIEAIIAEAKDVISFVKDAGMMVRFSCEDAFRSNMDDILSIYTAVDELGVDRVGIADTVGIATPFQVVDVVSAVRQAIRPETGIEFHTHNDTGCCIANALLALQAGATHINTCVLGIGERNGITPLGGFLARMYTINKDAIKNRYDLTLIRHLERYVARASRITIPFNNYVTGSSSFTHKAGVHSKAVMSDPSAYEVIDPEDFGVSRTIEIAHPLTGWNAVKARAKELSLDINDDQIKATTRMLRQVSGTKKLSASHLDEVLIYVSRGAAPHGHSQLLHTAMSAPTPELQTSLKTAATNLEQYEIQLANDAFNTVAHEATDARPTMHLRVVGHLFDKAVLNRLLDLAVDSPCSFQVKDLVVPEKNEDHSSAVIQLWGDDPATLASVRDSMEDLIKAHAAFAECSIHEVDN